MTDTPSQAQAVVEIIRGQSEAAERGILTIWTVYDRPRDHPTGFIARRFEIDDGKASPTGTTLTGPLDLIRESFTSAGLVRLPRDASDEPQVVESWI
jgi:hypothetical protein